LKDLRLIAPEVSILPRLYLSVSEFLSRVKRETTAPQHAVVCTKDDTFLTVLQKICANRVHRVWIVDSSKRPVGVVSLRDVLWYIFVRATEKVNVDDMDTS
jgi:CBS domain-containing protein